jgi:hypothetical protein
VRTCDPASFPAPGTAVLVAPLNWGLGHATRCVPLVRALAEHGCKVHLASDGVALDFLRHEFPLLPSHPLPSWEIRYAPGPWLVPGLLAGIPRLLRALAAERRVVWRLVERESIGWILSDNRYGVRHPKARSILLTHQLRLSLPRGMGFLEPLTELATARLARGFDAVWVPDQPEPPGLSGKLGHPVLTAAYPPIAWIGTLTRMERAEGLATRWDSVSVISGPEPARTRFEARLRQDLSTLPGRHLLVRGRPDLPSGRETLGNLEIVPHLPGAELGREMQAARVVVTRGGYSSLMEMARLRCRCLVVPTPGQTEQAYLARMLAAQGKVRWCAQDRLDLRSELEQAMRLGPLSFSPA